MLSRQRQFAALFLVSVFGFLVISGINLNADEKSAREKQRKCRYIMKDMKDRGVSPDNETLKIFQQARDALNTRDWERAEGFFERVLQFLDKDWKDAGHNDRPTTQDIDKKNVLKKIKEVRRAIEEEKNKGSDTKEGKELLRRSREAYNQGFYEEAIQFVERILTILDLPDIKGEFEEDFPSEKERSESEKYVVLEGQDYLFSKENFIFQEKDSSASDGFSVCYVKNGRLNLAGPRWKMNYSRLQMGKWHSLFVALKAKKKKESGAAFFVRIKAQPAKQKQQNIFFKEIAITDIKDSPDWQTIKIGTFKLKEGFLILLSIPRSHSFERFAIDKFYLTSSYEPQSKEAFIRDLKPKFPASQYREVDDFFPLLCILRFSNPLNEDNLEVALERGVIDAKKHYCDVVFPVGTFFTKKALNKDVQATIRMLEEVLHLGEEYKIRILLPLNVFYPKTLLDKRAETTKVNIEENLEPLRKTTEEYIQRFSKFKSLWAYSVMDEPRPHQIRLMSKMNKIFENVDNQHPLIFSVQFPHQVEAFSFQNFLFSGYWPFVGIRRPYPLGIRKVVENARRLHKGPYWMCLQSITRPNSRRTSRYEYRYQAYQEILGGVKGLIHYVYYRPRIKLIGQANRIHGFVNAFEYPYEGTFSIWDEVRSLNRKLTGVKDFIKSSNIIKSDSVRIESEKLYLNQSHYDAVDFVILKEKKENFLLIVNNIDVERSHRGSIVIDSQFLKGKYLYNLFTLERINPDKSNEEEKEFFISLSPGDGIVFAISSKENFDILKKYILKERLKKDFEIFMIDYDVARRSSFDTRNFEQDRKKYLELYKSEDFNNAANVLKELVSKLDKMFRENESFESVSSSLQEVQKDLSDLGSFFSATTQPLERGMKKAIQKERKSTLISEAIDKCNDLGKQYFILREDLSQGKYSSIREKASNLSFQSKELKDRFLSEKFSISFRVYWLEDRNKKVETEGKISIVNGEIKQMKKFKFEKRDKLSENSWHSVLDREGDEDGILFNVEGQLSSSIELSIKQNDNHNEKIIEKAFLLEDIMESHVLSFHNRTIIVEFIPPIKILSEE